MNPIRISFFAVIIGFCLSSVALSQSMHLHDRESGVFLGGGLAATKDYLMYSAGASFSLLALFDFSVSAGSMDYRTGDEGDAGIIGFSFMFHPFRAEGGSEFSLAPFLLL
jgi:hypothetical protein